MAVTRSKAAERAEVRGMPGQGSGWRLHELGLTILAGIAVIAGLILVYRAKSPDLTAVEQQLASQKVLNLNALSAREDLLPFLSNACVSSPTSPGQAKACPTESAAQIYALAGGLSNVGRIRPLMTGDQFRELKPVFVVRRPEQFRRAFFVWSLVFLAVFLLTHVWWSVRGFRGDQTLLPAVLLLSGIGLTLMISLRDPVRDNLLFV